MLSSPLQIVVPWLAVALAFTQATPLVQLQRRQTSTGAPGSNYPPAYAPADPSYLPQAWTDALNTAVAAGLIPDIPVATVDANGNINYANNLGNSQQVCSWTTIKCTGHNDVTQAPDNVWMVAFDDGPTPASPDLYNFLQSQNQTATHYYIGSNAISYQAEAKQAQANGQELAVHTWSHHYMTTLSNEVILGELGWTMQIIYDLTGRKPASWRPPYGDIDNRVRAIAENVFGLKAVMWNHECNDWCLQDDGTSACPGEVPGESYNSVNAAVYQAIAAPKSPGVILLEHELTSYSVNIFKNAYSSIKSAGWQTEAVSNALGRAWYANANGAFDTPQPVTGMLASQNSSSTSSITSASASTSSSSSAQGMSTTVVMVQASSTPDATTSTIPSGGNRAASQSNDAGRGVRSSQGQMAVVLGLLIGSVAVMLS